MSSLRRNSSALANRRMTLALLFSLALHVLILSLQFGLPGAGLPSLDLSFKKQRATPGSLSVQLNQSAAAPASQQSPQEVPSQLQQEASSPANPATPAPVLAIDQATSAAPRSVAKPVAESAPLSWVKLAEAVPAPVKPAKPAKAAAVRPAASAKTKNKTVAASAKSARQKKVLAPETQRLLTQNGWNEDGFVVAATPPQESKPDTEALRKLYDDIQQEGVEDPDERSKRLHEVELKRQQKQAEAQQKIQQQMTQLVAEADFAKQEQQLQQQMQQQMLQQSQQIELQAQRQAEQAAEQSKLAQAELAKQQLQQAREQQQREQQAQAQAQQLRAEAERQLQEEVEQQQRQARQSLIAQRQAEQAQQRQLKEAQQARLISEVKPDFSQQVQQAQQANQQALQKLEQQLREDEIQRQASEARERARNAEASQLAQQKAAQQRADSHHEQLNSQLRQGAVSDLASLSNQLAQAPVAIAPARPAATTGTAQGSDPLASARAVSEAGNKASGNAERGTNTGSALSGTSSSPSRPALAQDLTGSVRDQLKQLDRARTTPLAQSNEGEKRRRRSILGELERDVPLRMYIDSWKHKVERNANLNYSQLAKDRARGDPLVTVAIRSDGSVEEIIINRSSGRADLDEAVRRIVKINAKYAAFPPSVAAVYDVIEIRKVWLFEEVLRVIDEIR